MAAFARHPEAQQWACGVASLPPDSPASVLLASDAFLSAAFAALSLPRQLPSSDPLCRALYDMLRSDDPASLAFVSALLPGVLAGYALHHDVDCEAVLSLLPSSLASSSAPAADDAVLSSPVCVFPSNLLPLPVPQSSPPPALVSVASPLRFRLGLSALLASLSRLSDPALAAVVRFCALLSSHLDLALDDASWRLVVLCLFRCRRLPAAREVLVSLSQRPDTPGLRVIATSVLLELEKQ